MSFFYTSLVFFYPMLVRFYYILVLRTNLMGHEISNKHSLTLPIKIVLLIYNAIFLYNNYEPKKSHSKSHLFPPHPRKNLLIFILTYDRISLTE